MLGTTPGSGMTRRRFGRAIALVIAATVAASVQFLLPGVLAPRVAHAAPSIQTDFNVFADPSPVTDQGPATAIVSGPGGDLWMNQARAGLIKMTPSGVISECVMSAFDGAAWGYSYGYGIAVGPDGNLWATLQQTYPTSNHSSFTAGVIARVTPACGVTYFSTPTAGSYPYEIVSGPAGDLWFTENSANNIGVINTSGVMREFHIPTAASSPTGIVAASDGNLWFAESSTDKIGRLTPGGTFTEFSIAAGAQPHDITVGPDGNLWFTELGRSAIGTITTSGVGYVEYPTQAPNSAPTGITSGPDGALWFGEQGATTAVARITTSGSITEYPTQQGYPLGITSGPDGNIWWTSNATFHPGGELSGVFRLPLVPCGDLTNSVTSQSNGSGLRDTPGSHESVQLNLSSCGVPSLTGATTSTAVTPPSGCPAAPAIASFTSTLAYGQSTSQTYSFTDPTCLGTYTVTSTTTMASSVVATVTTYYVVSHGGGSHIVGDFNGDGYEDLAIASLDNGTVVVYYGGPSGLDTRAAQVFSETTPGLPSQVPGCPAGTPYSGDGFGQAVAAGRFAGGGYSDLAIGIPGCGATASSANGGVLVLRGGPAGLTATGSYFFYAPSSMSGFAEFGRNVASGDFNHDGYDDLAVSAPLQNGVVAEEGAVDILYGSSSGLSGDHIVTESSPGMPGPAPTHYDTLGWNMAVGDFKHNGYSDLAMVEGGNKCAVAVLYGSSSGVTFTGAQYLQAVGCSDYADFVAAGDFTGNGYDDLAISEPFGGSEGTIEIHYGSKSGLGSVAFGTAQKITPSTKGIPPAIKGAQEWGAGLAVGDIKHNGRADLIVQGNAAGCVVLWGTSTKLTAIGSSLVNTDCGGISIIDSLGIGVFSGSGYGDFVHCDMPDLTVSNPNPHCSVYPGSSTGLAASPAYVTPEMLATGLSISSNHDAW